MSLESMKVFKTNTGLDLWGVLLSFISEYQDQRSMELPLIERMTKLNGLYDFDIGAYAIHSLITNNGVSLDEVRDGMFRCGWRPSTEEGEYAEPWTITLVLIAYEIDKQFSELQDISKKKADI
jgi:hypothetical protein